MKARGILFVLMALVLGAASAQSAPPANLDAMLQPAPAPSGVVGVVLDASGQPEKLSPTPGTFNSVYAFVTVLLYSDFMGLHASAQIASGKPTLYVLMGGSPEGRVFLVRTKVNDKTHNRSLKMGKAGFGSYAGVNVPDPDWDIAYTASQIKPGEWAITPKAPLPAGEYGLYVPVGTPVAGAPNISPGGALYGFGVQAPHVAGK